MAFATPLVLDGNTADEFSFTKHSQAKNEVTFLEDASDLSAPFWMRIKHTIPETYTGDEIDTHLVQLSYHESETPGEPTEELRLNFTVRMPRKVVDSADTVKVVNAMRDFFSDSGRITSLLRGEL